MAQRDRDADTAMQIKALGEALAAMRRDRGLSQGEAGARVGMTSQGWGLYESGRRMGLFRPDVQRRLTSAIDGSPEDLALMLASGEDSLSPVSVATGVESGSRSYDPTPLRTRTERLQLSNDDLSPWAASGVVVEFDPGIWPRRDQGCVIDTISGERLVRIYDRTEGTTIHLRGGPDGLDARTMMDRDTVHRVCAVIARRDQ